MELREMKRRQNLAYPDSQFEYSKAYVNVKLKIDAKVIENHFVATKI